jgi:hypothetical protein
MAIYRTPAPKLDTSGWGRVSFRASTRDWRDPRGADWNVQVGDKLQFLHATILCTGRRAGGLFVDQYEHTPLRILPSCLRVERPTLDLSTWLPLRCWGTPFELALDFIYGGLLRAPTFFATTQIDDAEAYKYRKFRQFLVPTLKVARVLRCQELAQQCNHIMRASPWRNNTLEQ